MKKEIHLSDNKDTVEVKDIKNGEAITEVKIENKESEKVTKENIFSKIKKAPLWLILTVCGLTLLLGISAFYYFGIYRVKPIKNITEIVNISQEYLAPESKALAFEYIKISDPDEPRTEESPINGLLFTKTEMDVLKKRRPVAVMINNHVQARPQSSLNSADLVFEAIAESGITRYMGIFWSEGPAKVGSIRSARQYFLEWLSPFDALYIHDGCASSDDPRVNACGNIYTYNIKNISTIGAWRWSDGKRYAPHNEYSSVANAWDYASKMGWDSMGTIESWKFKSDATVTDRGTKSKVKIIFNQKTNNGGLYDVIWTYDSKSNTYLRQVGGSTDVDQETNAQVYAKNIVIQQIDMTYANDSKGHLIFDTIDEGDAVYMIDGKISEGTWKKTSRTDRTIYYDSQGNEVYFNRGRTWIEALPRSQGKFDIIE